jgi:para-nitrobenzyl esterase
MICLLIHSLVSLQVFETLKILAKGSFVRSRKTIVVMNAPKSLSVFCLSILTVFFVSFKEKPHYQTFKASFPETVNVEGGAISGTKSTEGNIHIFKGIPFAAPPIGQLRWKAPQPVQPWTGVKKCDAFGPSPMQATPAAFSMWSEEFLIPKEPISEDCLYLNVWSGARSAKEKRPVLVWIYGGGFSSGGSAVPIYDGEAYAKRGVVFVSINYRVGVFGFLAHPDLTKESTNNASGNYGLMDQIAGLKWVQKNIAAFGGDPANVTIAGQSAGSMSVNCLVASPLAKGLFKKAIAESGANFSRGNATLQQAEQDGVKLAEKLGATSIADLRNMPADQLQKNAQGMRGPIIDGYVLPQPIADIFAQSKENDVALLTGWNQEEGLLFGPIKNAADFRKQAAQQYAADSATFLKYYPASTDAEAATSQLNVSRDMIFGAQNYTWANVASQQGKKVYVYRFTRKVPATGEYVKYGAFHTGEVPYAYDNLKFVNRPWEDVDCKLADVMASYWVNFIKTGNPNGDHLPEWPAYTTTDKKVMNLGISPKAERIPDAEALDFMAAKMSRR